MYHNLKLLVRKLIPKETLFQIEPVLRNIYSLTYRGKNHLCIVCNFNLTNFISLKNNDLLCPNCGSLSRDRRLYLLLKNNFLLQDTKVLDFSPSRCLSRKLKKNQDIEYISTDLSGNFNADYRYDITNIAINSETIDLIICYHVLEHIEDDLKAMKELFRILKPSGKAIIQTPFKEGEIYENTTIKSPKDRLKHFGQDDHVRIYSVNGLKERLESIGFIVQINNYFEKDIYHGFNENETILLISKV